MDRGEPIKNLVIETKEEDEEDEAHGVDAHSDKPRQSVAN